MTGAVLPPATESSCEIRFGQQYPDNNFCLLEVDESILEEITNNRLEKACLHYCGRGAFEI